MWRIGEYGENSKPNSKRENQRIGIKADALIAKCDVATLTSINEKGYPRTCVLSIAKADGFSDIYSAISALSEKYAGDYD